MRGQPRHLLGDIDLGREQRQFLLDPVLVGVEAGFAQARRELFRCRRRGPPVPAAAPAPPALRCRQQASSTAAVLRLRGRGGRQVGQRLSTSSARAAPVPPAAPSARPARPASAGFRAPTAAWPPGRPASLLTPPRPAGRPATCRRRRAVAVCPLRLSAIRHSTLPRLSAPASVSRSAGSSRAQFVGQPQRNVEVAVIDRAQLDGEGDARQFRGDRGKAGHAENHGEIPGQSAELRDPAVFGTFSGTRGSGALPAQAFPLLWPPGCRECMRYPTPAQAADAVRWHANCAMFA